MFGDPDSQLFLFPPTGEEVSAGGVVIHKVDGRLCVAAIRPRGRTLWALPKGHLDPGETALEAAIREVGEETGLLVEPLQALGPIHYQYPFRGKRVSKHVHFFLFRWRSGVIDALDPAMRVEVSQACWLPWTAAQRKLSYAGEREVLARAAPYVRRRR